jgi:hypothetical protein
MPPRDEQGTSPFPFRPAGFPALGGPMLVAYRIIWVAALAAAVVAQAVMSIRAQSAPGVVVLGVAQAAVLVTVAAMLFRRRPRDPVAAMLALAFLIWAVTGAADGDGSNGVHPWLAALDRLRFLLLVAALLTFPDGRFEPRWTAPALFLSCIAFLIGLAGVAGLLPKAWYLPAAVPCVVAAIVALVSRMRRAPPGTERQQLKWVAFGLATGLALILVYRLGSAFTPPGASGRLLVEAAFRIGVILMALGFLVSLLRYRLYDAESAISRSAAYLALTVCLVAVFAASEATIELIGQRYLGNRLGALSGGMAAAIAAALVAPLHQRMSHWAEQRFQRDLVILRQELPGLLADAQDQADLAALASMVLPRLEAGVHAAHIALVLDGRVVAVNDMTEAAARDWLAQWRPLEGVGWLDRDPLDPVFPLRIALATPDGDPFGWTLLGPRPDGSFYRQDELEALADVAVPLRRAILAARARDHRAAELREWRCSTVSALAGLSKRIAALEQYRLTRPTRRRAP